MFESDNLSLEQEFNLHSFQTLVQQMSLEQAQECLMQMYEQMIVRENLYKEFIKHQWGIDRSYQFE